MLKQSRQPFHRLSPAPRSAARRTCFGALVLRPDTDSAPILLPMQATEEICTSGQWHPDSVEV
ncbi:hypothetical protein GCM10009590_15090 [Brachybacterium alimentarium]